MARGLRLAGPGALWLACSAALAAGSVGAWMLPTALLDWQPALAGSQAWRWWTAAFVHWSPLHLGANLGAAAMVGAFGWAGRLPTGAALAWMAAWPLTHGLLQVEPALAHYGGLSGVLHAGVATAVLWLMARGNGRQRTVAALVFAGMLAKLVLEAPWGEPLRHSAEWDIATAPLGHATGAVAGLLCTSVALVLGAKRHCRAGGIKAGAEPLN